MERFPRKGYWMFWLALKASHLVDALNPHIDVASMIGPKKLSIAPCSFSDPSQFKPADSKVGRIVFAGHFNWQKGSELLIQIVKEWPSDEKCELVLCGSGPYEAELRDAAAYSRKVDIRRPSEIGEIFSSAKVFLSLQQWDNYPSQSLLEAMLCGCCVVATDVGDTPLLVKPPWGERLPLDASPRAFIAAALRFIHMDSEAQAKAGASARAFIVQHHSRERYLAYLRSLWEFADTADGTSRLGRR